MSKDAPNSDAPAHTSGTKPPKRWMKRGTVVLVLIVLLPFLHRLWQGYAADSQLQAEIDRIKAAGEPLFLAEFEVDRIPEDQNAAYYYREALATWPTVSDGEVDQHISLFETPPNIDQEQYLRACERAVALVRHGNQIDRYDWDVELVSPTIQIYSHQLGEMRRLSRGLLDAARRHHDMGNDAEALRLLNDALDLSGKVNQPRNLICYLVEVDIRAAVAGELQRFAHDLTITSDASLSPDGAATHEQVTGLIERLLDEAAETSHFRDALVGERGLGAFDISDGIATGRIPVTDDPDGDPLHIQAIRWWRRPQYRRETVTSLRGYTAWIESFDEPTLPGFRKSSNMAFDWDEAWENVDESLILSLILPSIDRATEAHFTNKSQLRLAALGLAIRLYKIDHGIFPESLDDLVPRYISIIPDDALAHDGGKLKYAPIGTEPVIRVVTRSQLEFPTITTSGMLVNEEESVDLVPLGRAKPCVYSVGLDGRDNGPKFLLTMGGYPDRCCGDDAHDLPFFLDGPVDTTHIVVDESHE